MKRILIFFVNIIIISCMFLSCFEADFSSPNDRFSDQYVKDNNALLAELHISEGTLNPEFNPEITEYTASVSSSTDEITTTAETVGIRAEMRLNDVLLPEGTEFPFNLDYGDNLITIEVTAEDGIETKIYTISITRHNSNADLSGLILSAGTLVPGFSADQTSYTASVDYSITSITVTPTADDPDFSSIDINGEPVSSGASSSNIPLAVGMNQVTITVTAEDIIISKMYVISITREPVSSNANLSSLVLSDGTLDPAFNENTTSYTANVAYTVSSVTVTPVKSNSFALITVNGDQVNSGSASDPVTLDFGNNNILIELTAEDGITTKIYNVTIDRNKNTEKDILSFMFTASLNSGAGITTDVDGVIDTDARTVDLTVPYGTVLTDLVPVFTLSDYAITEVVGIEQNSGISTQDFSINVTYAVIAQDLTSQVYTVSVYTAPNTEKDFLTFEFPAALNPVLSSDVVGEVDADNAIIVVDSGSPLLADVSSLVAVFTLSDNASAEIVTTGQQSGITVNNFTDTVTYTAIAEDLSTKDYTVIVKRGDLEAYLKAPNNYSNNYSNNEFFGAFVAISGDTIVVGASSEDSTTTSIINGWNLGTTNNDGIENGAAYVFTRSGTTWSHRAYLKAPNNSIVDFFGIYVAISGDTIVVGATGESSTTTSIINGSDLGSTNANGSDNGAVYIFR